ncbi:hypothetical protein CBOM_05098 [Ceraceosorus bombacis]|uniref:Uncharacterized protein n=1 Tax=Ceraceosorus bombacis TaxID=401625 RepID=A0A0P1BIJ7_9BASI|nr:hypothetical protein CBOM_05098 [Ceraceosorus bombacis]
MIRLIKIFALVGVVLGITANAQGQHLAQARRSSAQRFSSELRTRPSLALPVAARGTSLKPQKQQQQKQLQRRFLGKLFSCFTGGACRKTVKSPEHSHRWYEEQTIPDMTPHDDHSMVGMTPVMFRNKIRYPTSLRPTVRD